MAPTIQLLQAEADAQDESYFHIIVDGKSIKYITIDQGIYDIDDMCFGPSFVSLLPPLPSGDWNVGRVSLNPATVEYLELKLGEKLKSNVYEATCPQFSSTVVVKFARFYWEVARLEKETEAYEWIKDIPIGPDFLGHVAEEGRIIGFIMSRVDDAQHATPDDFDACRLALAELHDLGIKHGDVNKHNFLVRGGKATLIDFDFARRVGRGEMDGEIGGLMDALRDESGRGGRVDAGFV